MATKNQKKAEPIKDELGDARQEIVDLERKIAVMEEERDNAIADDSFDLEHVRDQLDSLAIDIDSSSAPQTHEQWRRCLKEIAGGGDWRNRTWK